MSTPRMLRIRTIQTPQVERLRQAVDQIAELADRYNAIIGGEAIPEDDCEEHMEPDADLDGIRQRRVNLNNATRVVRQHAEQVASWMERQLQEMSQAIEEIRAQNRRGWKE